MLSITWLGQASFVVRDDHTAIAIDLFLSANELRIYPPPPEASVPEDVSWFLCSHLHGDHFDVEALRARSRRGQIHVVVPQLAVAEVTDALPLASVIGLGNGDRLSAGSFTVTGIGATHGDTMEDAYREGPFLAYAMSAPGVATLFHAGDSIPSAQLLGAVRALELEVFLLPINGRDWFRERAGFVGNMTAEEAARFAVEGGARVVVPMHYDAIRGNTAEPADLVRHITDLGGMVTVLVPARGQTIRIGVPLP
jgi:L-ascorbate 6-phosphate lactonase